MHQLIAAAYQPPYAGTQCTVFVPVGRDGIRAEQTFAHLAQGGSREGRVERLQGMQFQQRGGRGAGANVINLSCSPAQGKPPEAASRHGRRAMTRPLPLNQAV